MWSEFAEHAQSKLHIGALEAYEQSQLAAPQCAAVLCNKAAALAKLERHEEAMAAAEQALAINKNYSKVRFKLVFRSMHT